MEDSSFEYNVFNKLGQLTVYYSELEEGLEHLVAALLNVKLKIAAIITHRQQISMTLNLLEGLFKEIIEDSDLLLRFEKWLSKARSCANRRNLLIHSTWAIRDPKFPIRSKSKFKKGDGFKSVWNWANPSEIQEIATDIEEITLEIYGILIEMESKGLTDYQNLPMEY